MKENKPVNYDTIVNYKKYGSEEIHELIVSHRKYATIEDIDDAIRIALKDELSEIRTCWY